MLWLGAATAVFLGAFAWFTFGGKDEPDATFEFATLASAAERTGAVTGARVEGTGKWKVGGETLTVQFTGEFNGKAQGSNVRTVMESPGHEDELEQVSPMITVRDREMSYLTAPALAAQLPGGKTWLRIDESELRDLSAQGTEPCALLAQLERAGDPVEVGHDLIGGAITRHYRASVEGRTGADRTQADVWVDKRGLVRRLSMAVPFNVIGGPDGSLRMTMDIFEFGTRPAIEVPPSGATYDATELIRQRLESSDELT